jgi:[ribosomal protein S5]-alanine N-acetyltransferase
MEDMRFKLQMEHAGPTPSLAVIEEPRPATDWRRGLPTLSGTRVSVRPLRLSDAASLFDMLSSDEVTRFISPPPTTLETFEKFILRANREREAGNYLCFAIVPAGVDVAIGLIQVRQLEPTFETAEWGFALGSAFWGTGMFLEAASLVLEFAFRTVGVHRMEARAAVENGRGAGALRKIGAIQEGVLRRSFHRNGEYHDQVLWTIVADEWRRAPERFTSRVH